MEMKSSGDILIVKLGPGDSYIECLIEACKKGGARTAVVISSIGQFVEASLGYYVSKGDYSPMSISVPHELVSVSGIISADEEGHSAHLHASLAGPDKEVIGGHLLKGTVGLTCETVLLSIDTDLRRIVKGPAGIKELSFGPF